MDIVEFLLRQNNATRDTVAKTLDRFTDWPAWVEAQCDVVDRIIELHRRDDSIDWCVTCDIPGDRPDRPLACSTLRALALPYSTHPEYREEWRP